MKIKETVIIQLALASVISFQSKASTAIYRNDFTVRTSAAPIPATNVWHEATPYRTNNGLVAFRPTTGDGLAAYEQLSSRGAYYNSSVYASRPVVDGWFIPFFNYRSAYTLFSDVDKCAIGTDGAYKHSPVIVFDKDNPALTFAYGSTARRAGVVLHSLHNSFTNGQLRIQVDMRAPERWASGYSYMRVFPVYDAYMDILAWKGSWCDRDQNKNENASITNSPVTPGKFGIRSTAGKITTEEGATRSYPQYYDVRNLNSGTTQVGNNYGTAFNYWHRFVVTYDLDNAKFGGTVYRIKQDVGHPTLDTEMVSENVVAAAKEFSNALWQNCATDAEGALTTDLDALWRTKGGISGIGVDAIGSFNTLDFTVTNKLVVDNFRISWKAPGADDFEVFYENDFHTRRYRTLSAAARTTEATYAPATVTTNAPRTYVYSVAGDLEKDRLMPLLTSPNDKAQPVGIDGWRVLPYADVNGSPNSHAGVLKYGGNAYDAGGEGGNMLTFGNQGSWGLLGQTLGASYSTGKVRIVADVRLPLGGLNTWHVNTRRASIGLGSTALYSANRDQLAANLAAGIGYLREVKTVDDAAVTNDVPYCLGASQTDATPSFTFEENPDIPEKATWYRYDVTADLATKKYDATITPIGTASVLPDFTLTNDAIYSVSSVPFAANVSDVGSFYPSATATPTRRATSTGASVSTTSACTTSSRRPRKAGKRPRRSSTRTPSTRVRAARAKTTSAPPATWRSSTTATTGLTTGYAGTAAELRPSRRRPRCATTTGTSILRLGARTTAVRACRCRIPSDNTWSTPFDSAWTCVRPTHGEAGTVLRWSASARRKWNRPRSPSEISTPDGTWRSGSATRLPMRLARTTIRRRGRSRLARTAACSWVRDSRSIRRIGTGSAWP